MRDPASKAAENATATWPSSRAGCASISGGTRLDGYRARTERLEVLGKLAQHWTVYPLADADGKLLDPLRGDHEDDDVVTSRAVAIDEVWQAIRRIARES